MKKKKKKKGKRKTRNNPFDLRENEIQENK